MSLNLADLGLDATDHPGEDPGDDYAPDAPSTTTRPLVDPHTVDLLTRAGLTPNQIGEHIWNHVRERHGMPAHVALALAPLEDGTYDLELILRVRVTTGPNPWLDWHLREQVWTWDNLTSRCNGARSPLGSTSDPVQVLLYGMCSAARDALIPMVSPDPDDEVRLFWVIPVGTPIEVSDPASCLIRQGVVPRGPDVRPAAEELVIEEINGELHLCDFDASDSALVPRGELVPVDPRDRPRAIWE